MSRDALREVLLTEWDPHDVGRKLDLYGNAARTRYDTYLQPLIDLVFSGADDETVIAYLTEREAESMCFPPSPSLARTRLARAARLIRSAALTPPTDA